jgi:hypothetical protein
MTDPLIAAAREISGWAFDVLRNAVTGLDPESLDWVPADPEHTNSITVLTTHALGATRLLMSVAVGAGEPERSHDAEFATEGLSADEVLAHIDDMAGQCHALLDGAPETMDWGQTRPRTMSDGRRTERTAAWYLIHSVDHLRGHADEAALTRHLLNAR